ncbi:MAG: hypothetical protein HZB16_06750 [Armatimonadetes bacterium]|nr:hypothetical protein [Armatimonadota bacterium]
MIPANTSSLRITVTGNTAGLSTPVAQVLASGMTTASFPGLRPGTYTVAVGAYPDNAAGGQLLALGANTNAVITVNRTTVVNVAMNSQVASVTVSLTPSTTDDVAAHRSRATLTAWTQAGGLGSIVPIDPSKVTWVSRTPAVATVASTVGNGVFVTPVTGGAGGSSRQVLITGRYYENPVDWSGSATLTVNPATTTGTVDVNVTR